MRILVIDDSEIIRKSLQRFLEPHFPGGEFRHAGRTGEALETCAKFKPTFITLDIHMPGASGLDFLKQVRETGLDASILVISADDDRSSIDEAMKNGAAGFLSKPYTAATVAQALEKIL